MYTSANQWKMGDDDNRELIPKPGSFVPPTYDANFHEAENENAWIHRMPYRYLGKTGMPLSLMSYGAASLANYFGDNVTRTEAVETIQRTLKSGVNYIETGPWYGNSEEIIGEALRDVPRETFYLSTKAGRYFTPSWENRFDFTASKVLKSIESSLEKLGLRYVDIIQVHDVEFCLDQSILIKETLPALESVVKAGKAKFIGMTSYCLNTMKNLIENSPVKIDSILSYSRYNFHDTSLESCLPFFEKQNVGVINASPVGMGLYRTQGPPTWHPSSETVKKLTGSATEFVQSKGTSIEKAALGFSLRPRPKTIASTVVSIPNLNILNENLTIVTQPYSEQDKLLYEDIFKIFERGLGTEPGHWEGVELAEYKKVCGL